ncbi:hypothetical protein HETIRDRAFT_328204, partial [Heterobasidion irregulare TC 32-1]
IVSCIEGISACIGDAVMAVISSVSGCLECIVGGMTVFVGLPSRLLTNYFEPSPVRLRVSRTA